MHRQVVTRLTLVMETVEVSELVVDTLQVPATAMVEVQVLVVVLLLMEVVPVMAAEVLTEALARLEAVVPVCPVVVVILPVAWVHLLDHLTMVADMVVQAVSVDMVVPLQVLKEITQVLVPVVVLELTVQVALREHKAVQMEITK